MKVIAIFIADQHWRDDTPKCRADNYLDTQIMKLSQIKAMIIEKSPIFDCGDLLNKHKISPYLEGLLIDILPDNFYTIAGNHDQPYHRIEDIDKGSLGVLIKSKSIKLAEHICGDKMCIIGFNYGNLNKEYTLGNKINIALVHEFISLDNFPGSMTPEQLCEKLPGFDYIFCGHNHKNFEKQVGKTKVINIGSMMRMDADQINYEPGFYIMYEDFTVKRIKFEINKNVINRKYIDDIKKRDVNLDAFVESLTNKYEITNSFKNNLDNYCWENKINDDIKNKINEAINELC